MNNQTINSESEYSKALATLTAQGFDIKSIVSQKAAKDEEAQPKPTEDDLLYQLTTPDSWIPHFESREPVLSLSTIRIGTRLTLTSGQRSTLRDRYEMTPTKVVEVLRVECFPGTRSIRELVLRSDLHVPDNQRKHILVHCRISDFANWWRSSIELDKKAEEEKQSKEAAKPKESASAALAESYLQYL